VGHYTRGSKQLEIGRTLVSLLYCGRNVSVSLSRDRNFHFRSSTPSRHFDRLWRDSTSSEGSRTIARGTPDRQSSRKGLSVPGGATMLIAARACSGTRGAALFALPAHSFPPLASHCPPSAAWRAWGGGWREPAADGGQFRRTESRMARMTRASVMKAMIFILPPQRGQTRGSTS